MTSRRRTLLIVIVTVISVLIVEVIVLLAGVFSGVYNVAASRPHLKPLELLLAAAMDRSVEIHARGIHAPAEIPAAEGARHYDHMCAVCHGAPGVKQSDVAQGLYPHPPELQRTANDWTVQQVYWLVKYGVKDTGMPAFGATHNDHELWAIAYAVKQLPTLTPDQYHTLVLKGEDETAKTD
jgi:mono/diheme cytochrome c family protein